MSGRLVIEDQRVAMIGGALAITLGAFLLRQAFETRGKARPLWARLLPNF
ncbi:MAG: hypothetical protein FWF90_17395 [Promicromonosporaceae bacterium]|nr:hypothetical protein [Promicromonosporaceae bacterium]